MKHKRFFNAKLVAVVLLVCLLIPAMAASADEPSWTELASMSDARVYFGTEVVDGKIYAIGGVGDSVLASVEVYDPDTNTWATLSQPMSTVRRYHQTEAVDGKIYAIGGFDLSSAEVYDPNTNIWTTIASMSTARKDFQTEVIDGKIYAIGGLDDKNKFLSSVEVYDPDTDTWITLASMSTPRCYFQTAVLDGKIYAISGLSASGGGQLSSAEVYDPNTDTWTTLASMSDYRINFAAEVVNGKIYVIGRTSSIEVYDPSTDRWTILAPMPTVRHRHQTEVINGKIYVIGGYVDGGPASSVEVYDPDTNTWAMLAPMSTPRQTFQTEVINGTIYAVGGMDDNGAPTSSVECYTPASQGTLPDAPANLTATARDTQVSLSWDPVSGAASYTVMRATTLGGPYTAIATGVTETAYTDTDVTNGITYYYVVVAVNGDGESTYSNEASATPTAGASASDALLRITMVNGEIKEYEMDAAEINSFVSWCDSKGAADPAYMIEKDYNLGPFTARNEYIVYDKISSYEVLQY